MSLPARLHAKEVCAVLAACGDPSETSGSVCLYDGAVECCSKYLAMSFCFNQLYWKVPPLGLMKIPGCPEGGSPPCAKLFDENRRVKMMLSGPSILFDL